MFTNFAFRDFLRPWLDYSHGCIRREALGNVPTLSAQSSKATTFSMFSLTGCFSRPG